MPGEVYSSDFRDRIRHLASIGFSGKEISTLLAVPESSVSRISHEEMGSGPGEDSGGRHRKLSRGDVQYLLSVLEQQPDLYLDELQEELELQGIGISLPSLCRYMDRNGLTHKRLSKVARQRDHLRRAQFRDAVLQYDPTQLVSVDEAAVDSRNMNRDFGWSYSGKRARVVSAYERGTRYSVLPAISHDGILHANIVEGSFNAITFRQFISGLLDRMNPFPGINSVILLDNASIHHSRETLDMITARGMRYCFLPPYSPDYQPIEEMFNQLKQWIRRNYREGRAAMDCVLSPTHPYTFLFEGLDSISINDIQSFFRDTGYSI